MTYTIAILTAFILFWLLSFLLNAYFLQLGLRWAKVEQATFSGALKATVTMSAVSLLITLGQRYFYGFSERLVVEDLIVLLLQIVCMFVVMRLFFATTVLRSLQAFVPTFVSYGLVLAWFALVYIPFIGEAFIVPTGSMAPTILGQHFDTRCEQCDQPAFIGASREPSFTPPQVHCICGNFHATEVKPVRGPRLNGDRLIVAKFLKPQRWEVAVFQLPSDPEVKYVKRLIGLPGETIHIEDGSVFVNGERLAPPEHLAGIVFSDSAGIKAINGTKDNPAILGPDEYFMLGDNTERAFDARFWQTGAPGHNPYAVPESHIEGVVTTIYWPPDRWRSFK